MYLEKRGKKLSWCEMTTYEDCRELRAWMIKASTAC